jgi:hypothetical protein
VGKWCYLVRGDPTYAVVQRVLILYERENHEQIVIVLVPHVWELVLPRWIFQADTTPASDVGSRFQARKAISGKVIAHWSIALNGCVKLGSARHSFSSGRARVTQARVTRRFGLQTPHPSTHRKNDRILIPPIRLG